MYIKQDAYKIAPFVKRRYVHALRAPVRCDMSSTPSAQGQLESRQYGLRSCARVVVHNCLPTLYFGNI